MAAGFRVVAAGGRGDPPRPLDLRPTRRGGGPFGGTFLFGLASDRPFAAARDLTLMAIAFWNTPAKNDRDEGNLSLFYSPTSQVPYPLPGLAYAWRPADTFEAKRGVPASLEWRPDADWTCVAFYRTDTQIY